MTLTLVVLDSMYRRGIKRLVDAVLALSALVMLAPVIGLVSVVVRSRLGSPVLFRQHRLGLAGRCFTLLKFRTMTNARGPSGVLLPDAERLTRFGRWLRGTSLDELPELVNVLKGEMSLVGPRPLLVQYLERYSAFQARRHEVRPGITGLTQTSGRNALSWEEKFRLDVWYADNLSWRLDLQILLRTLGSVFRREGISAESHATMHEFRGDTRP